jgi:hypothetical protein
VTVTLTLAAFFLTFFPMLAVGIALGIWCRRVQPKAAPKKTRGCKICHGSGSVCNDCRKPGGECCCPDSALPTPMPCPACLLRKTIDGTVRIQELLDECKRKEI